MIKAEILTIGDELLFGQTLDTNAHFISAELDKAGIRVIRRTTIGDEENAILAAFAEAEQRADIILITGGLGPTSDDLTKPCLSRYFDCPLVMNEEALAEITEFFRQRGRELTELNRMQAALPSCCEKVTNPIGTAPGMWFHRGGKVFVSMPGVPHEMKKMLVERIIPKLKEVYHPPVIVHRMIRTAGIGESFLADKISAWEKALPPHIKLAYLPGEGGVKLRLTTTGHSPERLASELDLVISELTPLAGAYIFGFNDDPLEVVVGHLLRQRKLTLAIAESCTGGYLSHLITSIPGSSEYFQGSLIPYSYEIKSGILNVKQETLDRHGAVSEETIKEMALRVREQFRTDIGVATSGIAGPGGATPEKPVGTVWIAYADAHSLETKKLQLGKERLVNIRLTATAALDMIRKQLAPTPG